MWSLFLERLAVDPLWVSGSMGLMLLVVVFLIVSMVRHRRLAWFYGAAVVMAMVFVALQYLLPEILETLVSYRSDWSLVFLTQNMTALTLVTEWLFLLLWYGLSGLILVLALGFWSLITFRWQRLKIVMERALHQSWFLLFFSVLTLIMNILTGYLVDTLSLGHLMAVMQLGLFLFFVQFFLRLVDNALLHTPRILMEFLYASGMVLLLGHFVSDWLLAFEMEQFFLKALFLQQVFSFFLIVLILGLLGTFFVRALFASAFFLQHYHRQTTVMRVWTSRVLLSAKDRDYRGQRILIGMAVSFVVGFVFLELILMELYLVFVPMLFLAYFFLFVLLDRQDDMRVRGDIVDKRIESEVSQLFFS